MIVKITALQDSNQGFYVKIQNFSLEEPWNLQLPPFFKSSLLVLPLPAPPQNLYSPLKCMNEMKSNNVLCPAGSINLICVPVGSLLSGILTQPFGRKPSMITVNLPFIIAWLVYNQASSVAMLYIALVLTGFSGGVLEAPVCISWRSAS